MVTIPRAFGLGFFAAVVISASQVVLDLNGHTLEQSLPHNVLQRFYSNIELADQPFVPVQGPSNFGDSIQPARCVKIKNGTLGRSSHHGIHGNDCARIVLEDLTLKNYEVAAIALNGSTDVSLRNVQALGSSTSVHTLGLFSAGLFTVPYLEALQDASSEADFLVIGPSAEHAGRRLSLEEVVRKLKQSQIATYNAILQGEAVPPIYRNPLKTVDGNAYGILLNARGIAVHGFPQNRINPSTRIFMRNVLIQNHTSWVNEVPALEEPGTAGSPETDAVGAVFSIQNRGPGGEWLSLDSEGRYSGDNVVANAQLLVAQNRERLSHVPGIRRLSISSQTLTAVAAGKAFFNRRFLFNGDSMFHANKGVVGLKIDGCDDVYLEDVSIKDTNNSTPRFCLGYLDLCGGEARYLHSRDESTALYMNRMGRSHPKSSLLGAHATDCRGISLASSTRVQFRNVGVHSVRSNYGCAIGIDVLFDSSKLRLEGVVSHVEAFTRAPESQQSLAFHSCQPTFAYGVRLYGQIPEVDLTKLRILLPITSATRAGKKAQF